MKAVSGGCPSYTAACLCRRADTHLGPHRCVCGGAWNHDGSIVNLPQMAGLEEYTLMMDSLFGAEPDPEEGTA